MTTPPRKGVCVRTRFSCSVGLVIFDHDRNVYMLERFMPYSVQNHLMKMKLTEKVGPLFLNPEVHRNEIINYCKHVYLETSDDDIIKYIDCLYQNKDAFFEDKYELPHGQSRAFKRINDDQSLVDGISTVLKTSWKRLWKDGFREWREECNAVIENFDINGYLEKLSYVDCFVLEFIGLDGVHYTQLYFALLLPPDHKIRRDKKELVNPNEPYKVHSLSASHASTLFNTQDWILGKKTFKAQLIETFTNLYFGHELSFGNNGANIKVITC
jgi:hypothetical protein